MALVSGGAYSEFIVAPDTLCMKIPTGLSFEQAASIPENWITAYQLLHFIAKIKKGDKVLIHAAASGVGCAAIQLCKIAGASDIIVTSRSQHKLEVCKSLGATTCLLIDDEIDFSQKILNYTNAIGVDVILDPIGSSYFNQNIECCAKDARWVLYGLMGGYQINLNLGKLMSRRLNFYTSTLRSRSLDYRSTLIQNFKNSCLDKFEDGTLKTVIDRIFDWNNVKNAHLHMENNSNTGKIIINTSNSI
uniref:Zinc binding alcohol dehydrogenase domain containing 2 n=1 Tax=Nephromyces sp. MMRI TaxID=2496275 RepID=A0A3Q8UBV8_9APIC|nr:zinc binding alcohol dehydrogenase domain containing 2 [Nephromyces sp. MMRI]